MEALNLLINSLKICIVIVLVTLSYFFVTQGTQSAPVYFKYLTPVAAAMMVVVTVSDIVENYEHSKGSKT